MQAKIYNDYSLPPLIETLEEIKEIFPHQTFLKAIIDNKIIGSVRGHKKGETCYIERLLVHPDFQNKGFGTKLMVEIEHYFLDIKRFELFTGHKSKKNIYLYEKLGYKEFKVEPINKNLKHVYFEKWL